MEPLLIDVPERIEAQRLILRTPRAREGEEINAAVVESLNELAPWLSWVHPPPTPQDSEVWVRKAVAQFTAREALHWRLELLEEGYAGTISLLNINWKVPKFEIGYWLRTSCSGKGYMTEAVRAVTGMAFEQLKAQRMEIHVDNRNTRSARVAERAGFTLDGIMRRDFRCWDGFVRDTRIYSKVTGE